MSLASGPYFACINCHGSANTSGERKLLRCSNTGFPFLRVKLAPSCASLSLAHPFCFHLLPAPTDETLTSLFGKVGFESQPYNQQGTLTFQSINLRVNYDPPVTLDYPVSWNFGYSYCVFNSTQLKAQTGKLDGTCHFLPPLTHVQSWKHS